MTTNHEHLRERLQNDINCGEVYPGTDYTLVEVLEVIDELDALRKKNEVLRVASGRYVELCRQLDTDDPVSNEASTLRNIIDDAINLGSECLHLHLDAARAAIGDSHEH